MNFCVFLCIFAYMNTAVLRVKTIWTYSIQLWRCTWPSNIQIIWHFWCNTSRAFVNIPWYITNHTLHTDLSMHFIKDEIIRLAMAYHTHLLRYSSDITSWLMHDHVAPRRFNKQWLSDLLLSTTEIW